MNSRAEAQADDANAEQAAAALPDMASERERIWGAIERMAEAHEERSTDMRITSAQNGWVVEATHRPGDGGRVERTRRVATSPAGLGTVVRALATLYAPAGADAEKPGDE